MASVTALPIALLASVDPGFGSGCSARGRAGLFGEALGGDGIDQRLSQFVHLNHQRVDSSREIHVHDDGGDRDHQSHGRGQQGETDALRQLLGLPHRGIGRDLIERDDHADDRAEQTQQRRNVRDAVDHTQVFAKLTDLSLAAVDHGLLDLDTALAPLADAVREDERDRTTVLFAQLRRRFGIEFTKVNALMVVRNSSMFFIL